MTEENLDGLISDFARFYILTILYEGPCHGYGILDKFKKRLGREISPSLVYPFLQGLEQHAGSAKVHILGHPWLSGRAQKFVGGFP